MNNTCVIVVTYNSRKYIVDCIHSIISSNPLEIMVVDNDSKDDTIKVIEENFTDVKIVKNNKNLGYGAAINIGVENALGDYVIVMNPDTIVLNDSLNHLIEPILFDEKTITTPKILLMNGYEINTCGNINHFTGLTFTRGFKRPASEFSESEYVSGISGACFALKKSEFHKIGGFDPAFFMYNEDSEFSWRSLCQGYRILYVPGSTISHHYNLNVTPVKLYHLEKNRYMKLKKNYALRSYLIATPSLLLTELLTIGFSLKLGWKGLYYKFKAIKDGLFSKVHKLNSMNNIFHNLEYEIPVDQLTDNIFEMYFKLLSNKLYKINYMLLT